MDIDLGEGWEKKVLIVVAVVVFILVVYAYNPFRSEANVTSANDSYTPPASTPVSPAPVSDNSTNTTNSTSNSGNNSFLITAEQAKNIAIGGNPGYTAGEPMQGTIVINQTTIAVWIVPISKFGQPSKTVYVDVNTGKIVNET
jgi:cytoskeletal protein RodZ